MPDRDYKQNPSADSLAKRVLDLLFEKKFDQANLAIEKALERTGAKDRHRIVALSAVLQREKGNLDRAIDLMKIAIQEAPGWLPHYCRLTDYLMEAKNWRDALAITDKLIALSETIDDSYFMDDARFRRILSLKALGRDDEADLEKGKLPAGTTTQVGNKTYRLDEL
jgi:tetratricopeptide (TPR) repeat protein